MKNRMTHMLVAVTSLMLLLTSCVERVAKSGEVNYLVGASVLDLEESDAEAWKTIETAYAEAVEAIPEVTRAGNFFLMEGLFSDCDAKVVEACKAAESRLTDVKLDGYAYFRVRGLYYGGEKYEVREAEIYGKSFGTKK